MSGPADHRVDGVVLEVDALRVHDAVLDVGQPQEWSRSRIRRWVMLLALGITGVEPEQDDHLAPGGAAESGRFGRLDHRELGLLAS